MAYTPNDFSDFARTQVSVDNALNNTTNPITIAVDDNSVFATISAGQLVTISSAPNPMDDASREKAKITAKGTGTVTLSRPAAQAHTGKPYLIGALFTEDMTNIKTALDAIGTPPKVTFDAVIAASGGDYTTLGAALAAGARSIYIRNGTYAESALNSTWSGTEPIYVYGESRKGVILQLANATTGWINLNISGSSLNNLTIKTGTTNLTNYSYPFVKLGATYCGLENCDFWLSTSLTQGSGVMYSADYTYIRDCWLTGSYTDGATVWGASGKHCVFENNWFFDDTYSAANVPNVVRMFGTTHHIVRNNNFHFGVSRQKYSCLTSVGEGGIISGNSFIFEATSSDDQTYCIQVSGANSIIANNYVKTYGRAISSSGNYVTIVGNTVNLPNNTNQSTRSGLVGGSYNTITGNVVQGSASAMYGIGGSYNTIITGNFVRDCTSTDSGKGIGISTGGAYVFGNMVQNCNKWYSDVSTGKKAGTGKMSQLFAVSVSGANTTLDFQTYKGFHLTMGASTTLAFTVDSENRCAEEFELWVVQDATGSRTITWPAGVTIKWQGGSAPTLTATANARDYVKLVYDPTDNAYMGSYVLNFA